MENYSGSNASSEKTCVDLAFFSNKNRHSDYLIDCALNTLKTLKSSKTSQNSEKTKELNALRQQFIMQTDSENANKDVSYGLYKASDIP